jgi:membrane-associated phospholipid phosphatase
MHARRGLRSLTLLPLVLSLIAAQPAAAQNTAQDASELAAAGRTVAAAAANAQAPAAASSPKFEPDPFIHLIQNTLHDLKAFASVDTAIVLGAGGGAAAATHSADDWITERVDEEPTRFWDTGGNAGTGYIHIGGAVATYAIGRLAGSPKTAHIGTDLIRAQVLSGIVTQALKRAVQRQRPGRIDGSSYSFPSGHTTSAWATSTVLWRHFGWKVGVPTAAIGAWVAAGRVQQREHFLSDVVFGAAVGIAGARTVTIGHGSKAVALRPTPVPGGMALLFAPANR